MANSAEVTFARKVSVNSNQWSAPLPTEFTGHAEALVLLVDPTVQGRPNAAIFNVNESGDRNGKPVRAVQARINEAPSGKAPSMWLDFEELPLAVWCSKEFWSIAVSTPAAPRVREYGF